MSNRKLWIKTAGRLTNAKFAFRPFILTSRGVIVENGLDRSAIRDCRGGYWPSVVFTQHSLIPRERNALPYRIRVSPRLSTV